MVKDYLKDKKISFNEKNVGSDKEAAMEMIKKSGQRGVPVIDIGGNIIIGFDQKNIDRFLS